MAVKNNAFSLIELMVVIAIVGVLAAIAVPVYQSYTVKAKLATVVQQIGYTVDQMIVYAGVNGHFPNAVELGLGTGQNGPYYVDDNVAANVIGPSYYPYTSGGGFFLDDTNHFTGSLYNGCGQYGQLWLILSSQELGLDPSAGNVYLVCYLWHDTGVVNKQCFYQYGADAHDGLVPGWIDGNSVSGFNLNVEALYSEPSYINATCM